MVNPPLAPSTSAPSLLPLPRPYLCLCLCLCLYLSLVPTHAHVRGCGRAHDRAKVSAQVCSQVRARPLALAAAPALSPRSEFTLNDTDANMDSCSSSALVRALAQIQRDLGCTLNTIPAEFLERQQVQMQYAVVPCSRCLGVSQTVGVCSLYRRQSRRLPKLNRRFHRLASYFEVTPTLHLLIRHAPEMGNPFRRATHLDFVPDVWCDHYFNATVTFVDIIRRQWLVALCPNKYRCEHS